MSRHDARVIMRYDICIVTFREMAPTRVLIIGHSFIHRLRSFLIAKYSLVKCIWMNSHTYPIKKKKTKKKTKQKKTKKKTYYVCVPHPLIDKINNDKVSLNTENMVKKGRTKGITIFLRAKLINILIFILHLHLNACISLNLIFGQSVF